MYIRADDASEATRTRPLGFESVSRYTSCVPKVTSFANQLSTILLLVALAPSAIEPDAATELDDLLVDTELGAALLDERLDGATDDGGTEEGAELDALPPHAAAVNCALFLPTPA